MSSSLREKIALHNLCQKKGVEGPSCIDAENEIYKIYESLIAYLLYDPDNFPTKDTHPEIKTLADEFEDLPDGPTKSSMYVGKEDEEYYKKKQFEEEERQKLEYLLEADLTLDEEKEAKLLQRLQWRKEKLRQRLQLRKEKRPLSLVAQKEVGGVEGTGIKSPPAESPGPPGRQAVEASGTSE